MGDANLQGYRDTEGKGKGHCGIRQKAALFAWHWWMSPSSQRIRVRLNKLTSSSFLVVEWELGKELLMPSTFFKDFLNPLANLVSVSIWRARHCLPIMFSCAAPYMWLPHILGQSRNFWISHVGLSIRHSLKGPMALAPGFNVGLSLSHRIMMSALLAYSPHKSRSWANVLWMSSGASSLECYVFSWRCLMLLAFQPAPSSRRGSFVITRLLCHPTRQRKCASPCSQKFPQVTLCSGTFLSTGGGVCLFLIMMERLPVEPIALPMLSPLTHDMANTI